MTELEEATRLDPKFVQAHSDLELTKRRRQLLPRLGDVAAGRVEPATPPEGCAFAFLCGQAFQQRYAAAVRLYEKAFAAPQPLDGDEAALHRYHAARFAALAASGAGADAPPSPRERGALRGKALAWLRVNRAALQQQFTSGNRAERTVAARRLSMWLANPDLAGLRAEAAQWDKFWAEVWGLRDEALKPPARAGKGP